MFARSFGVFGGAGTAGAVHHGVWMICRGRRI
jgi:hypothetical protein